MLIFFEFSSQTFSLRGKSKYVQKYNTPIADKIFKKQALHTSNVAGIKDY